MPYLGKTYLDHGGTTLYAKSLIDMFSHNLISNLYGNPHSASKPATLSGDLVDEVREKTLRFFGADPEHFDLVFVANATAGIKLVMESFRDLGATGESAAGFRYLYHKDAHTSIAGVRETASMHHCFHSDEEVEHWLNGSVNMLGDGDQPCLFSYPGQSNMTGRRLPLSWPSRLRSSSLTQHHNAYSLLDAAALATTSDLSPIFACTESAPDFTCVSFYKIFGFPDLGGLIVRRDSGHILQWRKFFGGGTILMATVLDQSWHYRKETTLHEALEDGTLPFHNIIALGCAIDVHRHLFGSMERISRHTQFLGRRLYKGLRGLSHWNGSPLITIYNDEGNEYQDKATQGSTVAFNIRLADGSYVAYVDVEEEADMRDIYLRSGGLCNPGGIATYLNLKPWEFKRSWSAGHRCGGEKGFGVIGGKPTGVVRASLGAMSTIADVDTLLGFLAETYRERFQPLPPRVLSSLHYKQSLGSYSTRTGQLHTVERLSPGASSLSSIEPFLTASVASAKKLSDGAPIIPSRRSTKRPFTQSEIQPRKTEGDATDDQLTPPVTPPLAQVLPVKTSPKQRVSFGKSSGELPNDMQAEDAAQAAHVDEEGRKVWYKALNIRMKGRHGRGSYLSIRKGMNRAKSCDGFEKGGGV